MTKLKTKIKTNNTKKLLKTKNQKNINNDKPTKQNCKKHNIIKTTIKQKQVNQ